MHSLIVSESQQADGTYLIHEQHTADDGVNYEHIYFAPNLASVTEACQLRGQAMQAELNAKALALALSVNYEIPLTDIEIMRRLTPAEWAAFQTSTDINIQYFRDLFAKAKLIYRTDSLTLAGFSALISAGILTEQRKNEVLV